MITPNIIYYARLSLERNGSKTPKYVITATARRQLCAYGKTKRS